MIFGPEHGLYTAKDWIDDHLDNLGPDSGVCIPQKSGFVLGVPIISGQIRLQGKNRGNHLQTASFQVLF